MELKEIVLKLNGNITPLGDSTFDGERFENLKNLCNLVNELVTEIDYVSYNFRDSHAHSEKKASDFARKFLSDELGIEK